MHYRAEIDGLRAVAVLPVMFFHAGFALFGGGYVGVDIFFVISGYLITSIILWDLAAGRFSIIEFYERRARRILPALFVVMLACLPLAWLWLLPQDLQGFSQSLVAVSLFASNVLFWLSSGYFDVATELKPLLHTWSLAVEEQYYVLFPLLMLWAWRLGRRWMLMLLASVAALSLAAAQWGSTAASDANFYLLHARAWELMAGAFVAFHRARHPFSDQGWAVAMQAGAWLGLSLLVYAVLRYDATTPFPSLYTLVPVSGAVLLILCADQETTVGRLLGSRVLVGAGMVSYSAYLWHQPIFAFARVRQVDEPSGSFMLSLIGLSLLLALASWRWVETPFRNRQRFSRRTVFLSAATGVLFFIGLGMAGHLSEGFEQAWMASASPVRVAFYQRYKREDQLNKQLAANLAPMPDNGKCRFNARNLTPEISARLQQCRGVHGKGVAILGDSHAIDLYGVVAASRPDVAFLVGVTQMGCRPHTPAKGCHYADFLSFVQSHPDVFSLVVFEQAGFYLLRHAGDLGSREMFSQLPLTAPVLNITPNLAFIDAVNAYLEEVGRSVPVVWFGPRLEHHISKRHVLQLGCAHDYILRPNQRAVFQALDAAIGKAVAADERVRFLSQTESFDIQFPRDLLTCSALYWSDGDHFSAEGEQYFARRFDLLRAFGH